MKFPFELVSIHIPKSAGTSFRLILQSVYGEESVRRLDIGKEGAVMRLDKEQRHYEDLPSELKVAHGHFTYNDFVTYFGKPDVPIITWLRHPVERLISQYFFLRQQYLDQVIHTNNSIKIFNRLCRNLKEFAELPNHRNLQGRYLKGIEIEEFAFIGIVEDFDDELVRLGKTFNWKIPEPVHANKTRPTMKEKIEPELYQYLLEINSEDMKLYQSVIERRS